MNGAAASDDEPARLDEVAEHAAQTRRAAVASSPGLRRLREHPRLLGIDEPVRLADEVPQRGEGVVEQQRVELRRVRRDARAPTPPPSGASAAARGAGRSPPR